MNYNEKRTLVKLVKRQAVDAINEYTAQVAAIIKGKIPGTTPVTKARFRKDHKAVRGMVKRMQDIQNEQDKFVEGLTQVYGDRNMARFVKFTKEFDRSYDAYLQEINYRSRDAKPYTKGIMVGGMKVEVLRDTRIRQHNNDEVEKDIAQTLKETEATYEAAIKFLEYDLEAEVLLGDSKTATELLKELNAKFLEILS